MTSFAICIGSIAEVCILNLCTLREWLKFNATICGVYEKCNVKTLTTYKSFCYFHKKKKHGRQNRCNIFSVKSKCNQNNH